MDASKAWGEYYTDKNTQHNFYPENFVSRIFLSENPVKFLDKNFEGKSILDLGCGHGRHIPLLLKLGFKVSGLEVTDRQVEVLQNTFKDQSFMCGSSAKIPADDLNYDYILACNSIYYLDQKMPIFSAHLEEASRTIKDGGILIFSMLGAQHSLLKDCSREGENAIIKKDFLGFRAGTLLRPIWDHNDTETILQGYFTPLKHGEILEKCCEFTRHIHYFVAEKS